jgi:shikimate dehydrogenase
MLSPPQFDRIARCLTNRLDESCCAAARFAAVIGDAPSHYSKSPRLWNGAFARLQIKALYVPMDVEDARLGDLLRALRNCDDFLGANVTVPHKVKVMEFLDAVDAGARRIQAVNTIVRLPEGKLVGYNTDGEGFINSLHMPANERGAVFLETLKTMNVLVLGAGGSARAVAFHVADQVAGGKPLICNRSLEPAVALANEITAAGGEAQAVPEDRLSEWAPRAGLIVNCTTKGQAGLRRLADGKATLLEAYSALAPAQPPSFSTAEYDRAGFEERWLGSAGNDIAANQAASLRLAAAIPPATGFYDLIYQPEETVFLRHGRSTGHRTMNGKAMIVHQAAIAFHQRICQRELRARGLDTQETRAQILRTMFESW